MKNLKKILQSTVVLTVLSSVSYAQNSTNAPLPLDPLEPIKAQQSSTLKEDTLDLENEINATEINLKDPTEVKKISYSIGALLAKELSAIMLEQKDFIEHDLFEVISGIQDGLKDKSKYSEEELDKTIVNFYYTLAKLEEERTKKDFSAENAQKTNSEAPFSNEFNNKFIEAYKKDPNVKQTESGLLYKVISPSSNHNQKPKFDSQVSVKYVGYLINGKKFDESSTPITFPLSNVIEGWREGLQLANKGDKIELLVPPNLAYGDMSLPNIPANSILIFQVDLIDFK